MKRQTIRQTTKLKTLQKGTIIAGGVSLMALGVYFLTGLNTVSTTDTIASGYELLINDPVNNGEIVCGFSWENSNSISDIGPSAVTISKNAEITSGGQDGSNGLSAGNSGKDIDMNIGNADCFNGDGIDFSIDFRKLEESGNFISRGKYFNFGFEKGKLTIKYKLQKENGKLISVDEVTRYEIPDDSTFRSYRFIYNPSEAKAEIFVNSLPVWSSTAEDGDKMWWNKSDNVIIGSEMNGNGLAKAILDNMVIRSTNRARTMPMKLLSFNAEVRGEEVMITWFTSEEKNVDFFRVERSTDTFTFKEIGKVPASGNSNELKAYAMLDKKPDPGVVYYRLSLPGTDVKSVWVPVIALRIKNQSPGSTNTSSN